eukprot:4300844-Pyramimonas_sp.AAC.1
MVVIVVVVGVDTDAPPPADKCSPACDRTEVGVASSDGTFGIKVTAQKLAHQSTIRLRFSFAKSRCVATRLSTGVECSSEHYGTFVSS